MRCCRLIDDWATRWWRLWSVRLNAIGLALTAWMWFDPGAVLYIVNIMPPSVRAALPPNADLVIGGTFFALAMLARLVKQPKLDRKPGG